MSLRVRTRGWVLPESQHQGPKWWWKCSVPGLWRVQCFTCETLPEFSKSLQLEKTGTMYVVSFLYLRWIHMNLKLFKNKTKIYYSLNELSLTFRFFVVSLDFEYKNIMFFSPVFHQTWDANKHDICHVKHLHTLVPHFWTRAHCRCLNCFCTYTGQGQVY